MSPCARGCCWTPTLCARQRDCACHWEDKKPRTRTNGTNTYSDPTANEAVRNVMKAQERRK